MPMGMAPPPAADVASQMSPSAMAAQQPPAPQGMPGQPEQSSPDSGNPVTALVYTALIHLQEAMQQEPGLAPYISSAVKTIQVGLGTVLGKQQQSAQEAPAVSQSPTGPGVGMPI